jgi:hypothetical protein
VRSPPPYEATCFSCLQVPWHSLDLCKDPDSNVLLLPRANSSSATDAAAAAVGDCTGDANPAAQQNVTFSLNEASFAKANSAPGANSTGLAGDVYVLTVYAKPLVATYTLSVTVTDAAGVPVVTADISATPTADDVNLIGPGMESATPPSLPTAQRRLLASTAPTLHHPHYTRSASVNSAAITAPPHLHRRRLMRSSGGFSSGGGGGFSSGGGGGRSSGGVSSGGGGGRSSGGFSSGSSGSTSRSSPGTRTTSKYPRPSVPSSGSNTGTSGLKRGSVFAAKTRTTTSTNNRGVTYWGKSVGAQSDTISAYYGMPLSRTKWFSGNAKGVAQPWGYAGRSRCVRLSPLCMHVHIQICPRCGHAVRYTV